MRALLVRYDKHGSIKLMAIIDGWVMCKRPRCAPFVLSEAAWLELSEKPLPDFTTDTLSIESIKGGVNLTPSNRHLRKLAAIEQETASRAEVDAALREAEEEIPFTRPSSPTPEER